MKFLAVRLTKDLMSFTKDFANMASSSGKQPGLGSASRLLLVILNKVILDPSGQLQVALSGLRITFAHWGKITICVSLNT